MQQNWLLLKFQQNKPVVESLLGNRFDHCLELILIHQEEKNVVSFKIGLQSSIRAFSVISTLSATSKRFAPITLLFFRYKIKFGFSGIEHRNFYYRYLGYAEFFSISEHNRSCWVKRTQSLHYISLGIGQINAQTK
jgi:hypothetical protein